MICWKIFYDQCYTREELKPIQMMILQKAEFNDILDACEENDFNFLDEAYIDLAIQLGWNVDDFIENDLEKH